MQRDATSHKGDNGRIAIIGGSHTMHGAPILSGLAAEASGVDLVYACVPRCHQQVTCNASLNFQVHPFHGDEITNDDVEAILELLAIMDCAVIGPGLPREENHVKVIKEIIQAAACPLILDATALQSDTLDLIKGKDAVLTPHDGELERMMLSPEGLEHTAKDYQTTIFLKGPTDHVHSNDGVHEQIIGGNAGLTVGGTGDLLAGLIAGLRGQGVDSFTACTMSGHLLKQAATQLEEEIGYSFRAVDVIDLIPGLLKEYEEG